MCRSRFDENKRIHGQILHNNMSGRGCIRCRVLWEQRLKIHEINFQIAAFCVISVYSLKPEENEQLYVLIDPASSSSGLLSNHKHGVHGKLVFPNLVEVLLSLCCLFCFIVRLGTLEHPDIIYDISSPFIVVVANVVCFWSPLKKSVSLAA